MVKVDGKFELTDLYTELVNAETNEVLITYQPVKPEPVKELPEPFKGYPAPDEITSIEENNDIVKKRDDSFIRQISVLTLAGQPEKAVEYIEGAQFAYREGEAENIRRSGLYTIRGLGYKGLGQVSQANEDLE